MRNEGPECLRNPGRFKLQNSTTSGIKPTCTSLLVEGSTHGSRGSFRCAKHIGHQWRHDSGRDQVGRLHRDVLHRR
jgi:hypothetical protein